MGQFSGQRMRRAPVAAEPVSGSFKATRSQAQAHRAAFGLADENPAASAAHPLGVPHTLWAGPAGFILVLELVSPGLGLTCLGMLAAILFLGMAGLRFAAAVLPACASPRRTLFSHALPSVTVIAALHDEAPVVAGLVQHLAQMDYPRDRMDVALVIEADDWDTLRAAHTAAKANAGRLPVRVMAVPPVGPRTKPKALNFALQRTTGDLVAVYDAEDAPAPQQLRAAAEAFAADPAMGCVQAPLGWYNRSENWLTRLFALEYAAQFHVMLPLFLRMGWPLPLGGTSNVFARDALVACGGWDSHNVTEDADLGFRLARHGWKTGMIDHGTLEEAPVSRQAWIAQRSRWLKGHAISWCVHMRHPGGLVTESGLGAMASLQASLGMNVLSALMHGPAALFVMWVVASHLAAGQLPWIIVPVLTGYGAAILAAARGARRAGFRPRATDLAMLPVYWLLQTPAAIRGLREIASQPYVWAKTAHGVTAQHRMAPDEPHPHAHPDDGGARPVRVQRMAQRPALRPGTRPKADSLDPHMHRPGRFHAALAGPSAQLCGH
jgi:hypothetical protein